MSAHQGHSSVPTEIHSAATHATAWLLRLQAMAVFPSIVSARAVADTENLDNTAIRRHETAESHIENLHKSVRLGGCRGAGVRGESGGGGGGTFVDAW